MPKGTGQRIPIAAPEGITIIFDQPKIMLFTEGKHGVQIKGIPESVGKKNTFRFRAYRLFEHCNINIAGLEINVCKHRNKTVLQNRSDGSRKPRRNRNHLVSVAEAARAQSFRAQGSEGEEIGRRAGIYQHDVFAPEKVGDLFREFLRETSLGQPKIKAALHQAEKFLRVKYTSGIMHPVLARDKSAMREFCLVMFLNEFRNLGIEHYNSLIYFNFCVLYIDISIYHETRSAQNSPLACAACT